MFTGNLRIPSLTCCCKQFRSFVLNTLHYITLHSVWQVRSFVDASSVSDHSFPRIKQSLVPRLSFQKCFTSQPSFRSIRYAPFDPHSLNPFRNRTAAHSAYSTFMQVRLLPHGRTVASRTLALTHSTPQRPGSQQCFHATDFTRIPVP